MHTSESNRPTPCTELALLKWIKWRYPGCKIRRREWGCFVHEHRGCATNIGLLTFAAESAVKSNAKSINAAESLFNCRLRRRRTDFVDILRRMVSMNLSFAVHRKTAPAFISRTDTNGFRQTAKSFRRDRYTLQLEADSTDDRRRAKSAADVESSLCWGWCDLCGHEQPPRCHHCVVCRRCILKRDHHCYFTGVCIGLTNQRHFIVMNLYIAVASVLGLFYIGKYLAGNFDPLAKFSRLFSCQWPWSGALGVGFGLGTPIVF